MVNYLQLAFMRELAGDFSKAFKSYLHAYNTHFEARKFVDELDEVKHVADILNYKVN